MKVPRVARNSKGLELTYSESVFGHLGIATDVDQAECNYALKRWSDYKLVREVYRRLTTELQVLQTARGLGPLSVMILHIDTSCA